MNTYLDTCRQSLKKIKIYPTHNKYFKKDYSSGINLLFENVTLTFVTLLLNSNVKLAQILRDLIQNPILILNSANISTTCFD